MKKITYIILQSFFWLQILIFGTYLAYPTPLGIGSNMNLYFRKISIYHINIQNIFYGYAIILLALFLFLFYYKKNKDFILHYIILLLSFFTAIFAFCATRGYTWYFYGNLDRTNKSIIVIILCFGISFFLFKYLHDKYNSFPKNNKK